MNSDIKTIENKIKQLIDKNEDSIKGFEKAAENTKEKDIKSYFEKRAEQRRLFVKTLHNATPALKAGDKDIDGTIKGSLHRSWMDMKTFFLEIMMRQCRKKPIEAINLQLRNIVKSSSIL